MFLTTVAIAGGTLIAGSKVYQDNKQKREKPWTYAYERLEKKRKKGQQQRSGRLLASLVKSKSQNINPLHKLTHHRFQIKSLWHEDAREEQLLEIANSTEEIDISGEEQEINHYLAVSGVSLALTTAGALFYPPLTLLSLPALLYTATNFFKWHYKMMFKEKRVGVAMIDFISVTGTLATGNYFAASLTYVLLYVSRKLIIKTEDHSRKSLINVFGTQPRFIWIQREGVEVEIPFESLSIGDIVVAHAGETILVDGTIVSGRASIDQRTLTGESQPVEKAIGDEAFASTVVLSGQVHIEVDKAGASTVAAQIGDILNHTADFTSTIRSRGEKVIDRGAVPTLIFSALALPVLGAAQAVAVLYASFGFHMRIAAPISVLNFLRIASQNGILIKDGRSLELLSQIDTIVFDKTGTLTEEVPTVETIHGCNGYDEQDVLLYAAAAEYKQTHPIAQAIQQEAHRQELIVPPISDAKYEVGYGLKVGVEGVLVRVGSTRFMEMEGIAIPDEIKTIEGACHAEGNSFVYVALDNQLGGAIELHPTVRPEAKELVRTLQKRNIEIVIISGDHEAPTKKLAQSLGIDQYFAQVLPQDKAQRIEELQEQGKSVCFVGDGINDSIALKKANVSISLSGASTIATDTAGIILMDGSLKSLTQLLDIANELDRNLTTSTIMTIVPGLICVGGVFFFHFGLLTSIILYNTALALSVSNAMLPLFKYQRKQLNQSNSQKVPPARPTARLEAVSSQPQAVPEPKREMAMAASSLSADR